MAITAEDLPDSEAARIGREAIATKADVFAVKAELKEDIGKLSWKVLGYIGLAASIIIGSIGLLLNHFVP